MRTINSPKSKFVLSSMSDENVDLSLIEQDRAINKILNKDILLDSYTSKHKQICLTFMAMDPTTSSFRPDKKFWRWKAGNFDMYMNVPDYNKFRTATKQEAKKIIAELYLSGIKKYLSKQKDFKYELFYKDVKQLFEKEGII